MADTKITDLTELASGSIVGTDQLPIVDVSDTTQAASGSTKRTLLSSVLAYIAGATATLTGKTINGADNTLTVRIANDVSGLAANVAAFLATPSSANLRAAITDETGTGAAVFADAPTISGLVRTGVSTSSGAEIFTANAMGALEISTAAGINTKSISVDSTFTFSAAPSTDTWFGLILTNTDTNPHVVTIPSSYSFSLQAAITTLVIGASSRLFLQWRRTASGYELLGDTSYLNNYSATTAPTANDDLSDGYGPGSLWLDATANNAYICESNSAAAAVWHQLGGGGGGAVSITGTPVSGQIAEWTSASAIQGVAVTGTGNVVRATSPTLTTPVISTITNTGTVTLPTATDTLVARATTDTLTNKRVTKRVATTASTASLTIASDDVDVYTVTALAEGMTINAPSGTPTQGQSLVIRITASGGSRALTWTTGSSGAFRAVGVTLPTTVASAKTSYIGCLYNTTDSRWDAVAVATEA